MVGERPRRSPWPGPCYRTGRQAFGQRIHWHTKEIYEMREIHVGDLVVNGDPSVVGEVLATSPTDKGLHHPRDLDL
jgi:hypothetical protein